MDDDLEALSREEFLRGCLRYREALEHELPNAPTFDDE
jgi:hypothetical protein